MQNLELLLWAFLRIWESRAKSCQEKNDEKRVEIPRYIQKVTTDSKRRASFFHIGRFVDRAGVLEYA